VSQKHLDDANILVVLEQVRSKSMPQGMQRYRLVDPGGLARQMEGATELPGR